MEKRGISPLIATVLLLGFTVALAAVIMTWGTGFTKKMQEQTEETANIQMTCATDVVFDIKSVTKSGSDIYNILVSNDGKEPIKKWKIRFYENAATVKLSTTDPIVKEISAFGLDTITATPAAGLTGVRKVEVIPIISKGGKDVVCSQNIDSFGDTEGDLIT